MAEEKTSKKEKKKLSPEEFAFRLNSGGAYATATGDILGGSSLVYSYRDLSQAPEIQIIRTGAEIYYSIQADYERKLSEYKAMSKEERQNKQAPTIELPEGISKEAFARASIQYDMLNQAMGMRNIIWKDSYGKLTLDQATKMILYGKIAKEIPKEITELIEKNKKLQIGKIDEDSKKLKDITNLYATFHIIGNTARDVQAVRLKEGLVKIIEKKD